MKPTVTWGRILEIAKTNPIVCRVLRLPLKREERLMIMVSSLHMALIEAQTTAVEAMTKKQIGLCSWAPANAGECDLVDALSRENRELRERVCKLKCCEGIEVDVDTGKIADRDDGEMLWDEEETSVATGSYPVIDPDQKFEV